MSSSQNEESETQTDIIKSRLLNVPSHGIRRIGRANTLLARLFWSYTFWIFTVLMCTFIFTAIRNFVRHPTKIHLSIKQYRDPALFPAITFCNINPLQNDGFIDDIRNTKLPGSDASATVNESEYRQAVSDYIDRILTAHVNGETHPFVKWGFSLNDLLIRCIFNKRYCDRNLTQLYHPDYGNCYTFDNDKNVQENEIHNVPLDWSADIDNGDNNYKLYLELFLHQQQYNEYIENRAAFRIFIHRKNELPVLRQNSLFLEPNKYTKLSFSQSIKIFSQNCRSDLTPNMKKIFPQHIRYTQALCYKLCETEYFATQCDCIERRLAVFHQFFKDKNTNDTQTTGKYGICPTDEPCLKERASFNASLQCSECLPECECVQYSVESSYAYYPNVKARAHVTKRTKQHFNRYKNNDSSLGAGGIRDNIVAVEISASVNPTEVLTESPIYTWVDLISSIGGQTVLWIGVSLISFVEISELLYLIINRFYSYIIPIKNS